MMSPSTVSLRLLTPGRQHLPGILPSIARRGEGSSFASPGRTRTRPLSLDATVGIAFALLICVCFVFTMHDLSGEGTAPANPAITIGMRAWKDPNMKVLQQQMVHKDEQVAALELTLKQRASTLSKVQHNIHTQETLIANLQQRLEAERTEKLRAIYSLGVMSQSLDGCQQTSDRAEQQLESCRQHHKAGSRAMKAW